MYENERSISKPIPPVVNGNTNMNGGHDIAKDTECSHKNDCNEEPSTAATQDDIDGLASSIANGTTTNSKEEYPTTVNNSLESIQQNHFEHPPPASEKDTDSKSNIKDQKKPPTPHGFGINDSTSSIQGDGITNSSSVQVDELKQSSMISAGLANKNNDKDMVEDTKMSAIKSKEMDTTNSNNSDSDNSEEEDNIPIGMVGKPKRKEEELKGTSTAPAASLSSKEEIATSPPQTKEIQSNNNIDGIKSEDNDTNQQMRKRKTTFDQVEGATTKGVTSSCGGSSSPLLAKSKKLSIGRRDYIKDDKEKDPSPLQNPWDTQDTDNNKQQSPIKKEEDISMPKNPEQQNGNGSSSMKKEEEAEEELEYSDTEKIGKGGKPLCKAKGCQKYKQGKHGLCATHYKVSSSPNNRKQSSSAVSSPRRSPKRRNCKMEEDEEEEVEFVSSSTPTRSKRARITTDRLDPSPSVSKRRTTVTKSSSSTAIVVSEDKEESDDDDESEKEEEEISDNEEEDVLEYSDTENKKGKGGRSLCKAKSCQKCSQGTHGLCARHFKVSSQYETKKKKTSLSSPKRISPKRARSNSTGSASSDKKKNISDIRREAAKLGWERKKEAESPPQDKRKVSKRLFDIGQRVEAVYEGIGDEWYKGTVVGRGQGSYDIDYDDGDKDRKLHARFVRVLEEEDEDSWKCHKCETVNPTTKSRCRACLGWRGGSRSPIKKGSAAVTKPSAVTTKPSTKKFIPLERPSNNKKNGIKRSNSDLDNTDEVTYSNNGRVQRARKKPDTFNPQAGAAKDWRAEDGGAMKVSWDDSPSIQKPPRKKRAIQAASDDFFRNQERNRLIVEGSNVVVEEFPLGRGIWSAGGAGRVMNVHESIDGSIKYDVEYFVGGEEMGIDEKYVTAAKNWLEEKDSALDNDDDFSFSEMELPEGNAARVGSAAPRREVAMDVDLTSMSETAMYERTRFELLNGRDFWICTHCAIAMSSITSPCSRCKRKISFIPLEEEEFETFVRQQRETNRQKAEQWRLQWEQKVNGMKEEDWSDHEKQDQETKKPKSKPGTLDHYKQKSKFGSLFCQYMGCQATAHPSSEGFCREHYKVVQEDVDPAPYPLVFPEDAMLVTDSIFLTYSQMVPCTYGKSDRKGVYGFPGMTCKHCIGKGGGHIGRFFASSESSMYVASFTKSINNHLIGCTYCPDEVKEKLKLDEAKTKLKGEGEDKPKRTNQMGGGRRKTFFHQLWCRVQRLPIESLLEDEDSSDSEEEEEEDDCMESEISSERHNYIRKWNRLSTQNELMKACKEVNISCGRATVEQLRKRLMTWLDVNYPEPSEGDDGSRRKKKRKDKKKKKKKSRSSSGEGMSKMDNLVDLIEQSLPVETLVCEFCKKRCNGVKGLNVHKARFCKEIPSHLRLKKNRKKEE